MNANNNSSYQVFVGIDGGNRHLKYMRSGGTWGSVPSVIYYPEPRERYDLSTKSFKVEYLNGPAKLQGQIWIVGEWAALNGGQETFQVENKATAQTRLALAGIPHGTTNIKRLSLCLPSNDFESQGAEIAPLLVGAHTYKLNDQPMNVRIEAVETLIEGEHAFRYLKHQNFFPYPNLVNGVIDVGGGNTAGMLFKNGVPLISTRYNGEGMVQIARGLQPLEVLDGVESGGLSPRPDRILDAIKDGTFVYGSTGKSFKEGFNTYVYGDKLRGKPGWLRTTFDGIKRQWIDYISDGTFADIAIIGGGAWLMQPLTIPKKGQKTSRVRIPDDPQFVTVRGMCI